MAARRNAKRRTPRPRKTKEERAEIGRATVVVNDSFEEFCKNTCLHCSKEFTPSYSISRNTENYCSGECAWAAYNERLRKKERERDAVADTRGVEGTDGSTVLEEAESGGQE